MRLTVHVARIYRKVAQILMICKDEGVPQSPEAIIYMEIILVKYCFPFHSISRRKGPHILLNDPIFRLKFIEGMDNRDFIILRYHIVQP